MILSDQTNSSTLSKWGGVLLLGLLGVLAVWYFWPVKNPVDLSEGAIFCGFEKVREDRFQSGDYSFSRGDLQSDGWVRTGRYSCRVPQGDGSQYGFGYDLQDVRSGSLFRVEIWRFNPHKVMSYLTVQEQGGDFYLSEGNAVERREDGWERIELYFRADSETETSDYKVYVFTQGTSPVYFDDLLIEPIPTDASQLDLPQIHLRVRPEGMRQLTNKRDDALQTGLLVVEDTDWVKAKFYSDNPDETLDAEIRLKGDWLDHLRGDKWSFRIALKPGGTWRGMTTFSVHRPSARSYLSEWMLHEMWSQEDVLTTRYDFAEVFLNGKSLGIYAYEEHFEKQLVENRSRREGPIVRFNENALWASLERQLAENGKMDYDVKPEITRFEHAIIQPFNAKKTLGDPNLNAQYQQAVTLLNQYREGWHKASEIFDLERVAKYYAISDVFAAYHGIVWHNQRFYYNPVINRLEPIGYDGFSDHVPERKSFLGQGLARPEKLQSGPIFATLFQDPEFVEAYVRYLDEFTHTDYLNAFLEEIQAGLIYRQLIIKQEAPGYKLDIPGFIQSARYIRTFLYPYEEFSVRPYRNNQGEAWVYNYHELPVRILGYASNADMAFDSLDNAVYLNSASPGEYFDRLRIDSTRFTGWDEIRRMIGRTRVHHFPELPVPLTIPASADYIYYEVPGLDSVFQAQVLPSADPGPQTPSQELFEELSVPAGAGLIVEGRQVIFPTGQHQTAQHIIIPAGYRVHFEPGAELDLIRGSAFISRSPVYMLGVEENPVRVTSSDGSGNGFTVLQAREESQVTHTIFSGLNTLNYKGWMLTGAVTFYEANVRMEKVAFLQNHCEDGLNIIRSDIDLRQILVNDTPFDGFDCDFCRGIVRESTISNTGNDGLDFSGSHLEVTDCTLFSNGDKAISAGEASEVAVFRSSISGAPIGIAAKDHSVVVVDELTIKDCEQGFTAYQKKPEYGGGNILVKRYEAENIKRLYLALEGSRIEFNLED